MCIRDRYYVPQFLHPSQISGLLAVVIMAKKTTIAIPLELKNKLSKMKKYRNQPYYEVIELLIKKKRNRKK